MSLQAIQVHCPFCNGAHAVRSEGQYTCDYCLQPFTAVDAKREESRLLEQVQGWLQGKLGALTAATGAGVDASSRAFIFQQKVFPELRRDVDRSLETLGGHGQHPLVVPPVPHAAAARTPNPFLTARNHVGTLKELRARAGSDAVAAFAVTDADKAAVGELDLRVGEILHLFHVTAGGHAGTATGYAAARRSLEALLADLEAAMNGPSASRPGYREFLAAQGARFRGLCELCRAFEEAVSAIALAGEALAARLEALAGELDRVAQEVERGTWNPAESMPVLLAIQSEAAGARTLARWLRAYDAFAARSPVPFAAFVARVGPMLGGLGPQLDEAIDPWAHALRAARGEVAVYALPDFAWVPGWAEAARAKKALGLFGNEERVEAVEQVLVPCWLAEIQHSQAHGAVFRTGGEARSYAVVDACHPHPSKVAIFAGGDPALAQALEAPRSVGGASLALPRSGPSAAEAAVSAALRARPDLLNATPRLRGVVFLPAAYVSFASKAGTRLAGACLGGRVPLDEAARAQAQAARELAQGLA